MASDREGGDYTSPRTKYISGRDVHPCFRYFARCSPYFARWSARGAHSARSAFEPAQREKIGSFISLATGRYLFLGVSLGDRSG